MGDRVVITGNGHSTVGHILEARDLAELPDVGIVPAAKVRSTLREMKISRVLWIEYLRPDRKEPQIFNALQTSSGEYFDMQHHRLRIDRVKVGNG
jgi:hypothetical protein